MNPSLHVSTKKIAHNTREILDLCASINIQVCAVTKVFCGSIEIAKLLINSGIKEIGDSRISNLELFKDLDVKKVLTRIPMQSELDAVLRYSDVSYHSSIDTIRKLAKKASTQKKSHGILLMLETGDLREGINDYELARKIAREITLLPGVHFEGIGTNLSCFGAIIPETKHLQKLLQFKNMLGDIPCPILSGGNSSSLHILHKEIWPEGINHLRIGTAIFFGIIEIDRLQLPNMYDDAFTLTAEIVEMDTKNSVPDGIIAIDSFGEKPEFNNRGLLQRAILAIGKQDVDLNYIYPLDSDIEILGGSSDYTIINVTNCKNKYVVGDTVSFKVYYIALLRLMTSKYVRKEFI